MTLNTEGLVLENKVWAQPDQHDFTTRMTMSTTTTTTMTTQWRWLQPRKKHTGLLVCLLSFFRQPCESGEWGALCGIMQRCYTTECLDQQQLLYNNKIQQHIQPTVENYIIIKNPTIKRIFLGWLLLILCCLHRCMCRLLSWMGGRTLWNNVMLICDDLSSLFTCGLMYCCCWCWCFYALVMLLT